MKLKFNNLDLIFDLQKIKDIKKSLEQEGQKISLKLAQDFNLDYPYAIDVEDFSYFYVNRTDRDRDFKRLIKMLN